MIESVTMIMCFTCDGMPGKKGWRGYFRKDDSTNDPNAYTHIDCPKGGIHA